MPSQAMYVALRKLGLNAYHFLESSLQKANNHHQLWTEALQAKYYGKGRPLEGADFDKILWEYEVCGDTSRQDHHPLLRPSLFVGRNRCPLLHVR